MGKITPVKLQLGYDGEASEASVRHRVSGVFLEDFGATNLRLLLSNGAEISIELFERNPGQVHITADGIAISPHSGNRIVISAAART